jgi:ribulose-phosphate 3-epimerase
MKEIIPAILERDFNEIKNKLSVLRDRVKTVQLDLCDGIFVPHQTWPYASGGAEDRDFSQIMNEEEGMPYWQEFDFELDLMVKDAMENFDIYMKLGPKRMIFHLGAQKSLEDFEQFLEGLDMYIRENVQMGLAFGPEADLETVARLANKVDFLQCMGIDHSGRQGEKFDLKVLENIKFLKNKLPGITISVDGGVNLENAEEILKAGAERLAVGSGIWRSPDPIGALQDFQSLV